MSCCESAEQAASSLAVDQDQNSALELMPRVGADQHYSYTWSNRIRGGVTKRKRENLGKIPKGGEGLKKQTEIPNFNLGIVKTQVGGLDFSKMSEL